MLVAGRSSMPRTRSSPCRPNKTPAVPGPKKREVRSEQRMSAMGRMRTFVGPRLVVRRDPQADVQGHFPVPRNRMLNHVRLGRTCRSADLRVRARRPNGPAKSSATFQFAAKAGFSGCVRLLSEGTGGNQQGCFLLARLSVLRTEFDLPLVGYLASGDPPDAGLTADFAVVLSPLKWQRDGIQRCLRPQSGSREPECGPPKIRTSLAVGYDSGTRLRPAMLNHVSFLPKETLDLRSRAIRGPLLVPSRNVVAAEQHASDHRKPEASAKPSRWRTGALQP